MIVRRRIITNEEQDAHTGWRRVLCHMARAGAAAKAKQRTNKRERREGKGEARAGLAAARHEERE